ncbi:anhydro-N-acetylmuramic acid kinase [Vibrio sinensis]|uniref:Anhydro-N-acetylmuramic acid kinase n=1 Tax=Vibrio sinensis TaxID=2302434 RepID=A0A3A6QJT7_9VIBR|nr:anhydro-N-acetylmuramic acid kinase [Vibrio sinensis]RJX70430.1 anhydro-N-acetylmuramic acid kinase [Vibrio sinensis]
MTTKEIYIGVMSGTSMDGVDTALVSIDNDGIQLLASNEYPMPLALKQQLLDVCLGQDTNLQEIGKLDHQLGHLFADAVLKLLEISGYTANQVTAIGNHGQTVYHHPASDTPFTIQLGDANIIAVKTGIDTVADFRRKDMALGGQGAPLVPAFHQSLFRSTDSSVVVLNIGGIANISVLRPNQPVIGFDTGPGNMLMDAWCSLHINKPFDRDAQFALQGETNPALLAMLLSEPFLSFPPPKSTGRELFNLPWLENKISQLPALTTSSAEADVQRTLCEYTAITIANQVGYYQCGPKPLLLVCGGGARNPLLMTRIAKLLPNWTVDTTQNQGVDSDNMEAMAFAWLAQRFIHKLPSNLPEVTGATRLASLGVLYPKD